MVNKKMLEALKGSIKKWRNIVAGKEKDKGVDNCPLCQLFLIKARPYFSGVDDSKACIGCPVRNTTGQPYCEGTPYIDYSQAKWRGCYGSVSQEELMDKYAREELKFLKSLLPKQKGKKDEKSTRTKSEQRRVSRGQKRVAIKRSKNR